MRSTALLFATFLVFAAVAPLYAQDIEIEEEPGGDLGELGGRPKGPAAPEIHYGEHGPYGIIAGTYAAEDFSDAKKHIERDLFPQVTFGEAEYDNTLGLNLRAGYRWHPNMATEAEFEWLDAFELDKPDTGFDDGVGNVWSLTANQKAYLSAGRLQLFGVFGLGLYDAVDSEVGGQDTDPQGTGFGVRAGGGFNFYFNQHVGLNLEAVYNFGTGDLEDLRYTSLSWGFILHP